MEDYRLEQSGQEVQHILNGAAMQTDLTAENERAELAEQTLQGNIDAEALARENADGVLQGHIDDEETRAKAAEKQNADDIDAIEEKIPTQASSSNQLADKDFVEDLVSTSSATFRGTFNLVSDLHLTVDASYADIAAALGNAIAGADNNDFAFVMIPTSVDTPDEIARIEKYKFNGSVWGFEYVLNNSGFTAAQWAAINSGITSALVTKLGALPSAADLAAALLAKQDKLTFDQAPTPSSTNPVTSGGIYTAIDDEKGARINADAALQQAIEAILLLIPSAATALNQLADKAFVNSSIATDTATFRGTFNLVSDLQLTVDATHADIAAALLNAISGADNNDYAFVQIPTSVDTPTEIRVTERYKFDGTAWQYEYDLNNSGFTAAQWAAINSGITTLLVTKLSNLPNATELATLFAGKQNVLTFDNAPVSGSDNPVKSGGLYDLFAAIDAKMPTGASANNKLVAEDRLAAYVGGVIGALDATFDLTSTDGHVTIRMTQTDGVIASLQILTSDIASASALATLGGQVSTNADDIAALQALYNALQQSAPQIIEPTDTWPVASPSGTVIYRVIDRVNTPPQYYSDYMWNGTTMVLMATYNNAIDPRPKKASQNLVTSGGVFDNMGALDVSELNATENPHALAQYVDLSAALAAVPIDYQKGGMSIKFVQSSDNKYVQFFCNSQTFTTDVNNWEKTNLEDEIRRIDEEIGTENTFTTTGTIIPVTTGDVFDKMVLTKPSDGNYVIYAAFRKSDTSLISPFVLNPDTFDGSLFETNNVIVPNDAVDLYLGGTSEGLNATLMISKYGLEKRIQDIEDDYKTDISGDTKEYSITSNPEIHIPVSDSFVYPKIELTNTASVRRLYFIQERDSSDNILGYLYNPTFTLYLEPNESVVFTNVSLLSGTTALLVGSNASIEIGDAVLKITKLLSRLDGLEDRVAGTEEVTNSLTNKPYNVLDSNKKKLLLFKTLFDNKKCDIYNRCVVSFNGDSILGSQLEEVTASPEYNTGAFPPNMSRMIVARKFYDAYKFTGEDTVFRNIAHSDWVKNGFAISNKLNGATFNRFEDYGGAEGDTAIISTSGYKFFKLIWSGKYGYNYSFNIQVSTDGTTFAAPSTLGVDLPDTINNIGSNSTLQKYAIADVSDISHVKIILGNGGERACIWGCEMWNNPRLDVVVQAYSGSIAKWNYENMLDGYYGDYHKPFCIITDIIAINDNSYIESPQEDYQYYEWMMYNAKIYDYCQNHGIPMLLIRTQFGAKNYGNKLTTVVAAEGIGHTRNECAFIDISKMQDVESIPYSQIVGQDGTHLSNSGNQLYFDEIALLMS